MSFSEACAGEAAERSLLSVVSTRDRAEGYSGDSKSCGARSLFLVMILDERACTLEQVDELVPVGPRGSSLADIQRAAEKLGLPMEAVRCTPEALPKLALPAIVHLEPTSESQFHHYAVLVRVTRDSAVLLDPVDYHTHELPRRIFNQASTGYYLVPRRPVFGWELTVAWLLIGMLALGLSVHAMRARGVHAPRGTER